MTQDEIQVPSLPRNGFLRWKQLKTFVPFSRVTIWRKVQTGEFPEPVRVFDRAIAWRAEDVHRWIRKRGTT